MSLSSAMLLAALLFYCMQKGVQNDANLVKQLFGNCEYVRSRLRLARDMRIFATVSFLSAALLGISEPLVVLIGATP